MFQVKIITFKYINLLHFHFSVSNIDVRVIEKYNSNITVHILGNGFHQRKFMCEIIILNLKTTKI